MIPQHLSGSVEHYTPREVVEAARTVFTYIDFDPASCELANTIVQASRWVGLPNDGLACEWKGRVLLNAPGGRPDPQWAKTYQSQSSAVVWWRKLVEECVASRATEAIFVGFNLEILQAAQHEDWSDPLSFPFCVPSERLKFLVSADAWAVQLRAERAGAAEKRIETIDKKLVDLDAHSGEIVSGGKSVV